jgi:hypothetical protein
MDILGLDPQLAQLILKAIQENPKQTAAEFQAHVLAKLQRVSKITQMHVRPQLENGTYLFKEGVRRIRTFEVEYDRLLKRVVAFYINSSPSLKQSEIAKLTSGVYRQQLVKMLRPEVEQVIFPILDGLPNIGEDIYLFIYYWVIFGDAEQIVKNIAESGQTPPEIFEGVYGMLGLLRGARKAADAHDMEMAYSYLLDANHLIGMRDGAVYASTHVPVVTRKLHGKFGKKAQIDVYESCRQRVAELYASIQREEKPGGVKWSAKYIAGRIWHILGEEGKSSGRAQPILELSGVVAECRKLANRQQKNANLHAVPKK